MVMTHNGYVHLQSTGWLCKLAARVMPEHKVSSQPYRVTAIIDEKLEKVFEAKC